MGRGFRDENYKQLINENVYNSMIVKDLEIYEVQKHLTLSSHLYGPWPVIINKEFYDGLPEDLQKVVMDAAVEAREYNRQLSKEDEIIALELLKEKGMVVTQLTDEQKSEFKNAMSDVYSEVRKEVGEEFFDTLMEEVSK